MPDGLFTFEVEPEPRRYSRKPRTKAGVRLEGVDPDLVNFAAERDFTITSGRDSAGVHSPNSRHGRGEAVDLRVRDKSPAEVDRAIAEARAAGFNVLDERYGTGTGKHVHISKGRKATQPKNLLRFDADDSLLTIEPETGDAPPPVAPQTITDNDPAVLAPVNFYAESPEQVVQNRQRQEKIERAKERVAVYRRKARPSIFAPGQSPADAVRMLQGAIAPTEKQQARRAGAELKGLTAELEQVLAAQNRAQGGSLGLVRAEDERRQRTAPDEAARDRAYYESLPAEMRRPTLGYRPGDIDVNDPAQLRAARLKHEQDTGRAQAEAARIGSVPYATQARTLAGNVLRGVGEIPAGLLDTIGTVAYELDKRLPLNASTPKQRADYFSSRLAEGLRSKLKETLPADARLAETFTFDTLPKAFGSALGFAGPGWVTKSKYVVPAFLGVTAGFSEGYNDAKRAGASDDDALKSAFLNGGMGASEIIPASKWVGRMNRATSGAFSRVLKRSATETAEDAVGRAVAQNPAWRRMAVDAAKETLEEGGQEAAQTAFGNFIANTIVGYDPMRSTGKGVAEAALAGGIVGAGMSAGTQGLERLATRPVPESTETLRAQFQSALDPNSPRAAVLVTPGEKVRTPKGFHTVETDEGVLHLNRAKAEALGLTTPEAIEQFVAEQGVAPLIGKVAPVEDTTQGAALRTEDAEGRELTTSIVPTPDVAEVQAEVDRAQFPQAAVQEVIPAQAAVEKRKQEVTSEPSDSGAVPQGQVRRGVKAARTGDAGRVGELPPATPDAVGVEAAPGGGRIPDVAGATDVPTSAGRSSAPAPVVAPVATEEQPRQFEHVQFGRVTEEGPAGKGKVKVVDEAGETHTILDPGKSGRKNERAVTVRQGIQIKPKVQGENVTRVDEGRAAGTQPVPELGESVARVPEAQAQTVTATSQAGDIQPVAGRRGSIGALDTPAGIRESTAGAQVAPTPAPRYTRRKGVPKVEAQPTPTEARASVKKEKVSARTGLTETQTDYVAAELKDYAEQNYIKTEDYPKGTDETSPLDLLTHLNKVNSTPMYTRAGEPKTIKVPGDGEYTVANVAGANKLHQKITGKPIEGLPKEQGATVRVGTPQRGGTKAAAGLKEYAESLGGERQAFEALKRQQAQFDADPEAAEQLDPEGQVKGYISGLRSSLGEKRNVAAVRDKYLPELNRRVESAESFKKLKDSVGDYMRQRAGRGKARQEAVEQEIAKLKPETLLAFQPDPKSKAAAADISSAKRDVREQASIPWNYSRGDVDWLAFERSIVGDEAADALLLGKPAPTETPAPTYTRKRKSPPAPRKREKSPLKMVRAVTQTEAFKRWFGGSKVVDEKGEPKVLYHGTPHGEVDAFNVARTPDEKLAYGKGVYLTESADVASGYSKPGASWGNAAGVTEMRPAVYKLHARIEQPFDLEKTYTYAEAEKLLGDLDVNDKAWREAQEETRHSRADLDEDIQNTEEELQRLRYETTAEDVDPDDYDGGVDDPDYKADVQASIDYDIKAAERQLERLNKRYEDDLAEHRQLVESGRRGGMTGRDIYRAMWQSLPEYHDYLNESKLFGGETDTIEFKTEANRILQDLGYDGITHVDRYDPSGQKQAHKVWVAFNPEQVKSATGNQGTFDPSNPNILKAADADKSVDTLRAAEFTDLVPTAQVKRDGHLLEVNAEGHEILRRAFEQNLIRAGQDEGPAESAFDGVFINREQVRETVRSLKEAAREMRESGYEESEAGRLDSMAADLTAAAREGKGTAVAYLFDYAIPHEEFHRAGYVGAIEEALSQRHANFTELASHPAIQKAWDTYFNRVEGYERTDEALLVEETAAWIAGGKAETLGLSETQAVDYLDRWFESYAERNGDDALLNFAETGLTHVREIIGQVRERRADRRTGQEGVQTSSESVRSEPQQPREAQRGDTGGTEEGQREKLARRSLPETLREQGLQAADELYEIYPDKAATADAKKLLEDLGFEASVRLLESDIQHGAEHVQLSKILQRALLAEASAISADNPTEAAQLRSRQQELASALSARMTRGGQFIRGAQVLDSSAEDVMATAAKVAKERGRKLTAEEAERVHQKGEELEQASAALEVSAREVADKRREAESTEEASKRAAEGALTKREIEALRKRLASLREKEKRREQKISDLDAQIPRKARKPPVNKAPRQIAAESLGLEEAGLLRELQAALGMGSPLKMVAGEQGAARLDDAVQRIDNLRVAREMEKAGKDAKTIWLATGWEKGGDGKWKTELDDSGIKVNNAFKAAALLGGDTYQTADLEDILDHPELFKAYPQLRKVRVEQLPVVSGGTAAQWRRSEVGDSIGAIQLPSGREFTSSYLEISDATREEIKRLESTEEYQDFSRRIMSVDWADAKFNEIKGEFDRTPLGRKLKELEGRKDTPREWFKSVLLHEVQHAVQDLEGFARGGSPEEFDGNAPQEYAWYRELKRHRDKAPQVDLIAIEDRAQQEYRQSGMWEWLPPVSVRDKVRNRFYDKEYIERIKAITETTRKVGEKPVDTYMRLGGETEARNVQTRLGMSGVERAAKTLAETEDVDRASQIYLKREATPLLKMARAEGEAAPKGEAPKTALDNQTLDKLARLGALKLLRAEKGTLTVSDFKRDFVKDFGERVRPHVDAVHAEAVRIAREEVRKAHHEKVLDSISRREGNEELSREELEEIAAEEQEARRRAALVQREHEKALKPTGPKEGPKLTEAPKQGPRFSEGPKFGPKVTDAPKQGPRLSEGVKYGPRRVIPDALARAIGENAKSDEEVAAAARIIAGRADSESVRLGGPLLETARKQVRDAQQLAAALKRQAATSMAEVDQSLAGLQQARRDRAAAHQAVARELERIRKGKVRQMAGAALRESKGVMIALQASGDMSNLLRQGGIPALMQPQLFPEFAKATVKSVREAGFAKNIDVIERGADFVLKQRMGIDFAFAGGKSQGEEFFEGADILQRIPIVKQTVGKYVQKSDEVFGGGLDHLRSSLGQLWIEQLRSQGVTYQENPEAYKTVGRFINIITGRADIGEHNTAVTRALLSVTKLIGFSPRYRLSRIQFLTLPFNASFYQAHPAARRIVYKNVARYYATLGGTLGALSALGYLTGALAVGFFDPEDDDWLKVKIGNLRLDLTSGNQTQARFAFKLVAEGYRTATGEVTKEMGVEQTVSTVGRWFRSGADPRASLAADWWTGATFTGEPFKWGGLDGAIATRLMPISAANVVKAMQKEGPRMAAAQGAADFVGIGSQVYPDRADEPKTKAERLAARFAAQGMKGGKPRTEEMRRKLDELKGRARKGEDVRSEVEPLVEAEVITKGHGESIVKAKDQTLLQEKFRQLSLEDAKHVLKYATQAEREAVADIVRAKQLNEAQKKAAEERKRSNPAKAEADRKRAERAKERKRRRQEVRYGRQVSP